MLTLGKRHLLSPALALLLGASVSLGCAGEELSPEDVEDGIAVAPGKADNFLSLSAIEYVLTGKSTVTVEASYATKTAAEKLARAKQLVSLKQVALTWFLNEYLIEKEDKDANKDWGGFHALAKDDYTAANIAPTAAGSLTYGFEFKQLVAGKTDLLTVLPVMGDGAKKRFTLAIGKPSNEELAQLETNHEWYRNAPWDAWNPTGVAADKLEQLELTIEKEKPSVDGFVDYTRLFEDGKITIGVHFGWDYHSEYHLKHSKALYAKLVSQGYKSPVTKFELYKRTSGPLTKTIRANGKYVRVEISLFWGQPGTDTDPDTDAGGRVLEDDMRTTMKSREIAIYSGHSGPLYGFALANWKKTEEGDLDDSEMSTVPMMAGSYQVVLAEGCDTYSTGAMLMGNSAKLGKDIDVITTTAPSNASTPQTVELFLEGLVGTETGTTRHKPRTWSQLLTSLDSTSSWFHTMYGVHGIDDNPHRHPYANTTTLGKSCSTNTACGGLGNQCIANLAGVKQCAFTCTADDGCPTGFACNDVASRSSATIYGKQCIRKP